MSFKACTQRVKAGDPDRYASAPHLPELHAIYAFNLEVARAPWASAEPMIAEMRLQWWADAIEAIYAGKAPQTHEILPAVAQVVQTHALPRPLFDGLIQARRFDIYRDPHPDRAAFDGYIQATAGNVMELAARALGAPPTALPVIGKFAYGAGVANLLRALPELLARGRHPVPSEVGPVLHDARQAISAARAQRRKVPRSVTPALLAGWRSDATLRFAQRNPDDILTGNLNESPFARGATLRWRSLTGRW